MTAPRDPSDTAADPRHSAWVAANAGAGKTHTLANRVTRLLLADAEPAKILCLTFTKGGGGRCSTACSASLASGPMLSDEDLAKNINDIGAELGGPQELKKARRLFAKALETPGGLKILTIHAFCQNLLSRFPLEAGVPASFKVLDDQTARELMAQARTRVLERAGGGDAVRAAALAHLLTETSEARLQSVLDAALGTDRRKLDRYLQSLGNHPDAMRRSLRRAHGADENASADDIAASFCASARADELMRATIGWLAGGGKADMARADQLSRALDRNFALQLVRRFSRRCLPDRCRRSVQVVGNQEADGRRARAARAIEIAGATFSGSGNETACRLCGRSRRSGAHGRRCRTARICVGQARARRARL